MFKKLRTTSSIGEVWEFVAVSAWPMHYLKKVNFDGTTKPASRQRAYQKSAGGLGKCQADNH
jgi:hypothetical protein